MNLSRVITLIVILFSGIAFGQSDSLKYPKVLIMDGDTVQVFSIEQALELAKRNEQLKECDTLYKLSEEEIAEKDTIIINQEGKISNLETVVEDFEVISDTKDELLDICEEEKTDLKDEVKRQKRHKWIAIISGGVVAILEILF